ncbi:MAG: TetR/AcrR family transcriptional regulator [Candidatus Omnitrophica bacterium]|nr:TetR/AcrR family transcriptional regulator [Candidatus Omnitrophota bacterium]
MVREYSLREKKSARTKIAIINAFMERLKRKSFDDISIREVCRDAEVAQGTFFNYFPEKIDVISSYLHLMTSKMIWKAKNEVPAGRYLDIIDSVFKQLSVEWSSSNLAYQILSVLIAQGVRPKDISLSGIEKKLFFPDCPGIEEAPSVILDQWLKGCIIGARKNCELPLNINVDDVVISLITIITGTLLALRFENVNKCGYHYRRQLHDLWRVLGAEEKGR